MRTLRIIGLDVDGKSVICEDPAGGERFLIPVDERLHAAARGDVTPLGQTATEVEKNPMRPREIQARIRSGESVDQVAATAGLPASRIERFAYPVLLERSRTAELAQRAHPLREDGPDVQTLGEVVAHAFGLRGHDYSATGWDSWRGEDGKWVVQLHWQAGRSENSAHWVYHPGAQGGTVTALDEHAIDLMDPSPNRPLRTVRPVTHLARQALDLGFEDVANAAEMVEPAAAAAGHAAPVHTVAVSSPPVPSPPAANPPAPSPPVPSPPAASPPVANPPAPNAAPPTSGYSDPPAPSAPAPTVEPEQVPAAPAAPPELAPEPEPPAAEERSAEVAEPAPSPAPAQPAPEAEAAPAEPPTPARKSEPPARRGRKNHPIVPSWEDVLLGVRTPRP